MIDKDLILNAVGERLVRLPTGGIFALRAIIDRLLWQQWPTATTAEKDALDAIIAATIEGLGDNEPMPVERALQYGSFTQSNYPNGVTSNLIIDQLQDGTVFTYNPDGYSINVINTGWHRATGLVRWPESNGFTQSRPIAAWVDVDSLTGMRQIFHVTPQESGFISFLYTWENAGNQSLSFILNNAGYQPLTIFSAQSIFNVERLP